MFSLGTIFTKLDAETSGFLKEFAGATKTVERFAKDAKKAADGIAQVTGAVTAMAGGALALAATVDGQTKQALDGMKAATTGLAVEVSRTLAPAVKAVTADVRAMADWFAGLSPGTKQLISDFAVFAAQAALVGTVLSKLLSLVAALSGSIASFAKAIAGVGVGPFLGIALAVGAVLALVVVLRKAWRENWGGIQKHTQAFLQWFQSGFSSVFGDIGKWLNDVAKRFLGFVENITSSMQAFFQAVGMDSLAGLAKSAKEMIRTLREDVEKQGLGGVVKSIISDMADTGQAAGVAFKKELQLILKDLGIEKLFEFERGKSHSGVKSAPGVKTPAVKGGAVPMVGIAAAVAELQAGAMEAAEAFSDGMVQAAREAVDGITTSVADFGNEFRERFLRAGQDIAGAAYQAAGTVTSALGDLGDAIGGVVQGFQTGGIWGAIIALIAEILVRLESFQGVLGELQAQFSQSLGNINRDLKGFFGALQGLLAWITELADVIEGVVGAILKPAFDALGDILNQFTAVLDPIISIIDALGAVLKPIMGLFANLSKVLVPLAPLFEIIGFVLKIIALIILGIFYVIGKVINSIQDLFDASAPDAVDTGAIEDQINEITDSFGGAATQIDDGSQEVRSAFDEAANRIRGSGPGGTLGRDEWYERESSRFVQGMRGSLPTEEEWKQYLIDSNPNRAMTKEEWDMFQQANPGQFTDYQDYLESLPGYVRPLEQSFNHLNETVQAVNGSLTNMPSGYKVALARFDATDAEDGGLGMASLGGRGQTVIFNGAVTIATNDPDKFGEALQRRAYERTGSRFGSES